MFISLSFSCSFFLLCPGYILSFFLLSLFFFVFFSFCWYLCGSLLFQLFPLFWVISSFCGGDIGLPSFSPIDAFSSFFLFFSLLLSPFPPALLFSALPFLLSAVFPLSSYLSLFSLLFLFLFRIISENLVKRESPHLLLTGIYSEEMSKIGRLYKKITPLSTWSKIYCQYWLKIISKNA